MRFSLELVPGCVFGFDPTFYVYILGIFKTTCICTLELIHGCVFGYDPAFRVYILGIFHCICGRKPMGAFYSLSWS